MLIIGPEGQRERERAWGRAGGGAPEEAARVHRGHAEVHGLAEDGAQGSDRGRREAGERGPDRHGALCTGYAPAGPALVPVCRGRTNSIAANAPGPRAMCLCRMATLVRSGFELLWGGERARDALEGEGAQRWFQKRSDRRLEEVAQAVGGGYCRLQMPLKLAFGVRETVAGHRLGALEGGGYPPPVPMHRWRGLSRVRRRYVQAPWSMPVNPPVPFLWS